MEKTRENTGAHSSCHLNAKQIREIVHILRQLADVFEDSAKYLESSGSSTILVRSIKTLDLGLDNVRIGAKRVQEAVFEVSTLKSPLRVAEKPVDDYQSSSENRDVEGVASEAKRLAAEKKAKKRPKTEKPKKEANNGGST